MPKLKMSDVREELLTAIRRSGNISYAARKVGIHRSTIYNWISRYAKFARQVEAAKHDAVDRLEGKAFERATDPDNPSDRILIFLLQAHRPEVYARPSQVELSGRDGGAIQLDSQGMQERIAKIRESDKGREALQTIAELEAELIIEEQKKTAGEDT